MNQPASPRSSPSRLHPVLRVALYLPTLLAAMVVAGSIGSALVAVLPLTAVLPAGIAANGDERIGAGIAAQTLAMLAVIATTLAWRRLVDRSSIRSLGLNSDHGWPFELLLGFGLGAVLMTLIAGAEWASGAYAVSGVATDRREAGDAILTLGALFIGFVLVAVEEELVARGYVLQNLREAWRTPAALLLSSALFSVAHFGNPGAGLGSAIGIFAAGLLLAIGYLVTRRLWLPIGLHLSWNLFQGPIFGFPVSGIRTPGLLTVVAAGDPILTGGGFGPEASLIGVAANLLGILILLFWATRRRNQSRPGD